LVAIDQPGGQYLQFVDEENGITHLLTTNLFGVGSFANINTLDLQLVGDAGASTISAFYSINGAAFQKVGPTFNVPPASSAMFFNSSGRAGIIAAQKNDLAPITATFDSFEIDAGTPVASRPSVTDAFA